MFRRKKSPSQKYPIKADHIQRSVIASIYDDPAKPSSSLIEMSLEMIRKARDVDFSEIRKRFLTSSEFFYPDFWPGEHYKLLAGAVRALKPKLIIEIGSYLGLSSLALKQYMSESSQLVTFDIIPFADFPNSVVQSEDFIKGDFIQHIDDLSDEIVFAKYIPLFENAELIFIDASHDGIFEEKILNLFRGMKFKKKLYIMMDDIRLWALLKVWRDIPEAKLDLTSFGHWSGTGLIEWQ